MVGGGLQDDDRPSPVREFALTLPDYQGGGGGGVAGRDQLIIDALSTQQHDNGAAAGSRIIGSKGEVRANTLVFRKRWRC